MKEQKNAKTKIFLDIPTAAELAGFSARHFRKVIEGEGIPIFQIRRKFFILGRDLAVWETTHKSKRLEPQKRLFQPRRPRLY